MDVADSIQSRERCKSCYQLLLGVCNVIVELNRVRLRRRLVWEWGAASGANSLVAISFVSLEDFVVLPLSETTRTMSSVDHSTTVHLSSVPTYQPGPVLHRVTGRLSQNSFSLCPRFWNWRSCWFRVWWLHFSIISGVAVTTSHPTSSLRYVIGFSCPQGTLGFSFEASSTVLAFMRAEPERGTLDCKVLGVCWPLRSFQNLLIPVCWFEVFMSLWIVMGCIRLSRFDRTLGSAFLELFTSSVLWL